MKTSNKRKFIVYVVMRISYNKFLNCFVIKKKIDNNIACEITWRNYDFFRNKYRCSKTFIVTRNVLSHLSIITKLTKKSKIIDNYWQLIDLLNNYKLLKNNNKTCKLTTSHVQRQCEILLLTIIMKKIFEVIAIDNF